MDVRDLIRYINEGKILYFLPFFFKIIKALVHVRFNLYFTSIQSWSPYIHDIQSTMSE